MKKSQVQIGGLYVAKISGALRTVCIDTAAPQGGWWATNTSTNRRVRIRTAAKLRSVVREMNVQQVQPKPKVDPVIEAAHSIVSNAKPVVVSPTTIRAEFAGVGDVAPLINVAPGSLVDVLGKQVFLLYADFSRARLRGMRANEIETRDGRTRTVNVRHEYDVSSSTEVTVLEIPSK